MNRISKRYNIAYLNIVEAIGFSLDPDPPVLSTIFDIASEAAEDPEGESATILEEVAVTFLRYEDTGLTPDEIMDLKKLLCHFLKQALNENQESINKLLTDNDRIKEWLNQFASGEVIT